jgi:tRNA(fMet)-specific endonuclease VapC
MATLFLLDTDTVIFMIRGLKASVRHRGRRDKARAAVARCRAAQAAGDVVGLSAITVSELEFGARNSGQYAAEIAAVEKILLPFTLFDYDATACPPPYGRVRYDLEQSGQPIGAMDLLIAAHALALSATLVTNNLAHFGRVAGLSVVSWV